MNLKAMYLQIKYSYQKIHFWFFNDPVTNLLNYQILERCCKMERTTPLEHRAISLILLSFVGGVEIIISAVLDLDLGIGAGAVAVCCRGRLTALGMDSLDGRYAAENAGARMTGHVDQEPRN